VITALLPGQVTQLAAISKRPLIAHFGRRQIRLSPERDSISLRLDTYVRTQRSHCEYSCFRTWNIRNFGEQY